MLVRTEKQKLELRAYPEERSDVDTVGESGFLERVVGEFGLRASRGTALTYHHSDGKRYNVESLFRELVKGYHRCVEIGTFRGVSTACLAHYCEEVATVDIKLFEEAISLWKFFGVEPKILYCLVDSDASKAKAIDDFGDFDFAFIDGLHTYDAVEYDFSVVKKCGTVLFHDYLSACKGVKEFIDTLPKMELMIKEPFALWNARK
jgi:hypothetical protein